MKAKESATLQWCMPAAYENGWCSNHLTKHRFFASNQIAPWRDTPRGIDKPIGVSGFDLTRALPESLKSSLPTIEEIEHELEGKET